ncbi:hypothetical protein SPRG_03628 [Saprolegnia parasitica CBS 223.65]|uniref:IC97/Casc1 N-terminal domain-containing protein n=1 Tax=Saprolegnia parasitica (strain CBS 223.65) TaxID=695850 RepID=A0A067CR63_SAPPC|nr:hypothetical protein SPRG_03628 [Saprolegnia parasitica CBS 223.65]KDO31710.1 hypothetical protein SPRG_03628 [Saprolegnia parasitica CBS 223.65]|eukprot:XP_012197593.1 hypothetical protein SPRG_03628 [Saprolegnia parasitica CBS 223.65]
MGPKKKKGKKKSKEELEEERRLKDEEDLRIKQEEERRLEEERKRHEEEEKKRREEEAKSRAAELVRLADEFESSKDAIAAKAARLQQELRHRKEIRDWEKYLACETKPDATLEGDINAFVNSWLLEDDTDLPSVVKSCEDARRVILDLIYVCAEAQALNQPAQLARCEGFIEHIMELTRQKIETNTAHILQYADEFLDQNAAANVKGEVKITSAAGPVKVGLWINIVPKGLRNKKIDFTEMEMLVDVPKPVVMQSLAVRAIYLPYDNAPNSVHNLDVALGGVFSIDLLCLPPAPKRARGWVMRELSAEKIHRLEYPLEGSVATASLAIKVSVTLPKDVIYPANPRVGWWDANSETWVEDGISEILFNEEANVLNFNTLKLTKIAVLQQRNANHMKHSWSLKMSTVNDGDKHTCVAHLKLQNDMYRLIHLEVTDVGVRLVSPSVKQLSELNRAYLPPQETLKRLAMAGIDLTPSIADDARFGVTPKDRALEESLVCELLGIACAFEITSIPHGHEWDPAIVASSKHAVFSVKEIVWPLVTHETEDDVKTLDVSDYVHIIAQVDTETSAGIKFSTNRSSNPYDTYVHIKEALGPLCTPDAKDRMENSNLIFEHNLLKVLSLLRLFSYTQSFKQHDMSARRVVDDVDDVPAALAADESALDKPVDEATPIERPAEPVAT